MLRVIFLCLLLANGAFYAWSHDFLRVYGIGPVVQSEPERLARQVHPEWVRLLSPEEVKAADALAQADLVPKECLQAGPFNTQQADKLRVALEPYLPAGSWLLDSTMLPERWIVYMGKFPSAEALAKKRGELANLDLKFEVLNDPALEFGLSLGAFETREAAAADLARLGQRGIRTARVVREHEASQVWQLKLTSVTAAMKPQLDALRASLDGKTLKKCE
jgi:hypothetical protein